MNARVDSRTPARTEKNAQHETVGTIGGAVMQWSSVHLLCVGLPIARCERRRGSSFSLPF